MSADPAILEVVGLTVRYGGLVAVDRVDLEVRPGEIVGLIGPNGAGKTTFVDAVTGFTRGEGEVRFDGGRIDHLSAHRRARLGLARTWQTTEIFGELSVLENAVVASRPMSWRSVLADVVHPSRAKPDDAARDALQLAGISSLADRTPHELPLGQQKLVGLARALAARPKVVLLDEPAAGLDTEESRGLGRRLRSVAAAGIALLLIDHDMDLLFETCDRVSVLDLGRVIAQGTPAEVRADRVVIDAYLGSDGAARAGTTGGDGIGR
jgi:ABC-type branched-subunit amino acid transport system ATPase component